MSHRKWMFCRFTFCHIGHLNVLLNLRISVQKYSTASKRDNDTHEVYFRPHISAKGKVAKFVNQGTDNILVTHY